MNRTLPAVLARLGRAYANYRRPLWLQVQRRMNRKVLGIEDAMTGLRFNCLRGADPIFGEVFHLRLYDIPTVPIRPNDLVVDVGANHGFATCLFAQRGADVEAYEPSPTLLPILRSNISLNKLDTRVRVHEHAVTGKGGRVQLFETRSCGGGMNSVRRDLMQLTGVEIERTVNVTAISANALVGLANGRRIRLMKLDCEGSEGEILSELSVESIASIDSIALEFHPGITDAVEFVSLARRWGRFHVSKPSEFQSSNLILHLVNDSALGFH